MIYTVCAASGSAEAKVLSLARCRYAGAADGSSSLSNLKHAILWVIAKVNKVLKLPLAQPCSAHWTTLDEAPPSAHGSARD